MMVPGSDVMTEPVVYGFRIGLKKLEVDSD